VIDDGSIWKARTCGPRRGEQRVPHRALPRACAHGDQTMTARSGHGGFGRPLGSGAAVDDLASCWSGCRRDRSARGHADIIRELIDGKAGVDHDSFGGETEWRQYVPGSRRRRRLPATWA